jgi:quinol monooxygenase YgiN
MPNLKRKLFIVALAIIGGVATARARPSTGKEEKMVVEYIRYEIPSAQHEEFLTAYRSAAQDLGASPHCLGYEIAEGIEEPDKFTVRIEWDSVEGHERGFRSSSQFGSFFTKVKPFFTAIREMHHYQVAVHGRSK